MQKISLNKKYYKYIISFNVFIVIFLSFILYLYNKNLKINSNSGEKNYINSYDFFINYTEDKDSLGFSPQRKIVSDANENYYIAYRKKYLGYYEIYVSKFSMKDKKLISTSNEKPISPVLSEVSQRVPSIAIDSKNILHVVWYGADSKKNGFERQIKYSKSENSGETWSKWKNIVIIPGYQGEYYWQEHPYILNGINDELYVVWEGKDRNNKYQQIKFIKTKDHGNTWSNWQNINAFQGSIQSRPQILQDNKAILHVLMYSAQDSTQQIYHSYSADDGFTWFEWENVSDSLFDSRHLNAIINNDGEILVVWRAQTAAGGKSQILFSKYSNNYWLKPEIVSPSKKFQVFPNISVDQQNRIHFVWIESSKKYNFPKEEPEEGEIYYTTKIDDKFSKAILISDENQNFYPNFPSNIKSQNGLIVIYLSSNKNNSKLFKINAKILKF